MLSISMYKNGAISCYQREKSIWSHSERFSIGDQHNSQIRGDPSDSEESQIKRRMLQGSGRHVVEFPAQQKVEANSVQISGF